MYIIHEEKTDYASWFGVILLIPLGLFIGALVFAYLQQWEPFLTLLGESILIALIFYFIFPRRFQIYSDKLRIMLGGPFAINIPLNTIREARRAPGARALSYSGMRLATSTRNVIEIIRSHGANYVISPQHADTFLEQLNDAIQSTGR